jgi:peptidoglycan/xylan/chitin deacetylase (PgdA/CDA1 family)
VLHDGPGRSEQTAAVLGRVLPELQRRGYRVVTVSELVANKSARHGAAGNGVRGCRDGGLEMDFR